MAGTYTRAFVDVTPGAIFTVQIGTPGLGGAPGMAGASGGNTVVLAGGLILRRGIR